MLSIAEVSPSIVSKSLLKKGLRFKNLRALIEIFVFRVLDFLFRILKTIWGDTQAANEDRL